MSDIKWSQLPSVTNSTLEDTTCAIQDGISTKQTLSQIFNLFLQNTILNNAGDPNGQIGGQVYQLCWDTTNSHLYICTTSGDYTTAIWANISSGDTGLVLPAYGGTGVSSPTQNSLPIANGSNPFQFVSLTNGQILIGSTGSAPNPGTIVGINGVNISNGAGSITIGLSIISPSLGGTGYASPPFGSLPIAQGSIPFEFVSLTNGQILIGSTGENPVPSTITSSTLDITPGSGSLAVDLNVVSVYHGGTGEVTPIAHGIAIAEGVNPFNFIRLNDGEILIGSSSGDPSASTITSSTLNVSPGSGTLSIDLNVIPTTYGGTGLSSLPIGSLLITEGSSSMSTVSLTDGQILIGSTGASPIASTVTSSTLNVVPGAGSLSIDLDVVPSIYGGTGLSEPPVGGLLIAQGGSPMTTVNLTDGQILIGATTPGNPIASTLTAGSGITITNGPGSIEIAATAATGFLTSANNLSDVSSVAQSCLNLFSSTSISTSTGLTAGAYGQTIILNGTSSYAITLPTISGYQNKWIDFIVTTTTNTSILIQPIGSELICGQPNISVGVGDSFRLFNDGSNWQILNLFIKPCNFYAYITGTSPSIPSGSTTIIPYNAVHSNVGGGYDNTTYTFTCTSPGNYNIYHMFSFDSVSAISDYIQIVNIFLNDTTPLAISHAYTPALVNQTSTQSISFDIYLNLGDTVKAFCNQNSGVSSNILISTCYFGAKRTSLF